MTHDPITNTVEMARRFGISPLWTYRFLVNLRYVAEAKKIEGWYQRTGIFFIVSTGRTGTVWLAKLLSQIPGYLVSHEPIPEEAKAHRKACESPRSIIPYMRFRKRDIYSRCRSIPKLRGYGEVNGNLRRHIPAILEIIPKAKIIHLVRDGRDVVRSIMNRTAYTEKHPIYDETFVQPTGSLSDSEWGMVSRFEKVCWVWKSENEFMRNHIVHRSRFEDVISSYALFKKQILKPLGLELDEKAWQSSADKAHNITGHFTFDAWDEWPKDQKERFMNICGSEMRTYGYKI